MGKTVSGSVRPRPNAKDVRYFDIILELGKDLLTGKRKRVYYKARSRESAYIKESRIFVR